MIPYWESCNQSFVCLFTFCLFMFWLHIVVPRKIRKLRYTNRVNLSVFTLHLAETLYRHIFSVFYPFLKLADIRILWLLKLGITMLIYNKDDIKFVTEFPCFLGHPVDESAITDPSLNRCKINSYNHRFILNQRLLLIEMQPLLFQKLFYFLRSWQAQK